MISVVQLGIILFCEFETLIIRDIRTGKNVINAPY